MKASPKDIKGKGKLVSHYEAQTKKLTTNAKKVKSEVVKNQVKYKQNQSDSKETKIKNNKIKVFTITKKDDTTLIERTYMVDLTITFPFSIKGSQAPRKI